MVWIVALVELIKVKILKLAIFDSLCQVWPTSAKIFFARYVWNPDGSSPCPKNWNKKFVVETDVA